MMSEITTIGFDLEAVCHSEWNKQQDAGRPFEQAVEELIPQYPHYEWEIRAYWERWPEMLGGHIPEMVALQKYFLQESPYRVYALTNWSHQTMPIAREKYSFLQDFEGIVVSGEVKCVKPDPEIYHILFERFGFQPYQSVFIDDSFPHIETARQLGMKGIHYQNPTQVYEELEEMGIKVVN